MPVPRDDDDWAAEAERMGDMTGPQRQQFNNVMFVLRYMQKYREEYYSSDRDYEAGFQAGVLWSIKAVWDWWKNRLPAVRLEKPDDSENGGGNLEDRA